jgi:hypothetical protein
VQSRGFARFHPEGESADATTVFRANYYVAPFSGFIGPTYVYNNLLESADGSTFTNFNYTTFNTLAAVQTPMPRKSSATSPPTPRLSRRASRKWLTSGCKPDHQP